MGKGILVFMGGALLGGAILLQSSVSNSASISETVSDHEHDIIARQIALSAMNIGIAEAKTDFINAKTLSMNQQPFQEGHFNLNGSLVPPSDLGLHAVGMISGSTYYICSVLDPGAGGPIEGSLLIDTEGGNVNFGGNSFLVMGLDVTAPSMGGWPRSNGGPVLTGEQAVHAIGVTTAPMETLFESSTASNQEDNISGTDGDLDVYYGSMALDLDAFYAEAVGLVETVLPTGTYEGNTTYGSPDDPTIVQITGDAEISGSWEGFGVLLIDGDVTLSAGNFRWEGIVMVSGPAGDDLNVNLTGGIEIYGSLILRTTDEPPEEEQENWTPDDLNLMMDGNAAVMYSSAAIDRLAPMLNILNTVAPSKVRVLSRRESNIGC